MLPFRSWPPNVTLLKTCYTTGSPGWEDSLIIHELAVLWRCVLNFPVHFGHVLNLRYMSLWNNEIIGSRSFWGLRVCLKIDEDFISLKQEPLKNSIHRSQCYIKLTKPREKPSVLHWMQWAFKVKLNFAQENSKIFEVKSPCFNSGWLLK